MIEEREREGERVPCSICDAMVELEEKVETLGSLLLSLGGHPEREREGGKVRCEI